MADQTSSTTTLIVVAHAPLASAFLAMIAHVHGKLPAQIHALDVGADDALEHTMAAITTMICAAPAGAVVFTDLPGATPHNCATRACQSEVEVLSPVSAPLLLRAVNYQHLSAAELAEKLLS